MLRWHAIIYRHFPSYFVFFVRFFIVQHLLLPWLLAFSILSAFLPLKESLYLGVEFIFNACIICLSFLLLLLLCKFNSSKIDFTLINVEIIDTLWPLRKVFKVLTSTLIPLSLKSKIYLSFSNRRRKTLSMLL